jgi:hypothetical protein
VGAGRLLSVSGADADVELERLDEAGLEWLAVGAGGDAIGALAEVLPAAVGSGGDADWIAAVIAAIERELALSAPQRSQLLVIRATGTWFHATFAENRESIMRYGLDWRRMTGPGIAGSAAAEWPGVFLCSDLADAHWFARMGRRDVVDIWAVELDGVWLEGDPGADGGGGDNWMICPEPISPRQLRLVAKDISRDRGSGSV